MSNADALPIDIHLSRLLDWLISRRHCNNDFQRCLNTVREKIVNAIKDMPENKNIEQILTGTQLNYLSSRQIVEILKQTEADSKNIFGFYSSQRMKDWNEIISLYEKDNVYLAECAQILNRNVNYEIPSLKRQLNKLQASEEEFVKKKAEFIKQSHKFKNDYIAAVQKMGIKGEDINKEISQLLNEPPKFIADVMTDLHSLKDCRDYYLQFLRFTTEKDDINCLTLIEYLLQKGNTTFYEFRTGEEPEVIENYRIEDHALSDVDAGVDDNQIDFGVDDNESTGTNTTSNGNGDFVHIQKSDLQDENGINWDTDSPAVDMSVIDVQTGPKVAKGVDALTILQYNVTRNNFINELFELECFLGHRIYEMTSNENVLSSYQFQGAPTILQLSTIDTLTSMQSIVSELLKKLTNDAVVQLCLMLDNPKYVESVKQKLLSKLELSEKSILKSEVMEEKAKDCIKQYEELSPKIPLLIEKTREIQRFVESEISKRYKNRPVNVMGGVQIL
ncbi:CDK5 regulatory subunit-associated protein 3-like protein [Dinothrombium tinctorium]|uniref:CDK5 regulatory subunit-associated protein 3-like protein n=1 Tax=Dinothrombium tinctorium TaxID=1965070 RepID=A0A3S3RWT9_9ACAR|nr:CDK5 regulatory subunit-associated protein 3-like protein [Dinothrombium tinctorium]RWS07216.1 CDK5 regulatory subunit-associated protein 3-like protein [Dinothrombium tinctorium]